jgi:hypothetical protein
MKLDVVSWHETDIASSIADARFLGVKQTSPVVDRCRLLTQAV